MKSKTTFTKAAFESGKNGVPPNCLKRMQAEIRQLEKQHQENDKAAWYSSNPLGQSMMYGCTRR